MKKRGKDISKLTNTLSLLASGNPLPNHYKNNAEKERIMPSFYTEASYENSIVMADDDRIKIRTKLGKNRKIKGFALI